MSTYPPSHQSFESWYREPSRTPPEFDRHYRSRLFREDNGQVSEVWDTIEVPFEATGFPRGQLMYEAIANTKRELVQRVLASRDQAGLPVEFEREILEAPSHMWRCRLYRIWLAEGPYDFRYVQVWDTLAEPCEYRHELPSGDLLAIQVDYSHRRVSSRINQYQDAHSICGAPTWKVRVHT